jgi:hypothetical protein
MNLITRLRLIFGVVWLLVGLGIVAYQVTHPDSWWMWMRLGTTPISFGWAALVLGLYNLARWWSSRAGLLARKQQEAELAARSRSRRREVPPEQYDPNFDFSDKPPERERRHPAGGDPGSGAGESPNGSS